jgi:hypothetical protein
MITRAAKIADKRGCYARLQPQRPVCNTPNILPVVIPREERYLHCTLSSEYLRCKASPSLASDRKKLRGMVASTEGSIDHEIRDSHITMGDAVAMWHCPGHVRYAKRRGSI